MIFTFGSNEGGIHGGGAAHAAYKKYGARWGFSYGHMGQSFAIPTKGTKQIRNLEGTNTHSTVIGDTLPLSRIRQYVEGFIAFAAGHPELEFQVTCIGCGLAGLRHEQIAPMFIECVGLPNVYFDTLWKPWLGEDAKYWGTF